MKKIKSSTMQVQGTAIAIVSSKEGDYISLTDMLKAKDGEFFISDSGFKPALIYGEFAAIKSQAGLDSSSERYAATLPQLADEVAALSARVEGHIKKMGAVWK